MSGALTFVVLALATTVLACVATSTMTVASWSWLLRATRRLRTEDRPLAWMLVALGPVLVSVLFLVAAGIPSVRAELDHCLVHDHHPHFCLRHAGAVLPSPVLIAVALLVPMRIAVSTFRVVRSAVRMRQTMRSLEQASSAHAGVAVFPDASPAAFVVGLLRPRVYASAGLVSGDSAVLAAVLAHEHAHARRRDPLIRLVASFVTSFHLPFVARAVEKQIALAQELAADAEAAREVGDPLRIVDALLAIVRGRAASLGPVPAFTEGDLGVRVHALLEPPAHAPTRALWLGLIVFGLALVCGLASPDAIHHGIETVLGKLS